MYMYTKDDDTDIEDYTPELWILEVSYVIGGLGTYPHRKWKLKSSRFWVRGSYQMASQPDVSLRFWQASLTLHYRVGLHLGIEKYCLPWGRASESAGWVSIPVTCQVATVAQPKPDRQCASFQACQCGVTNIEDCTFTVPGSCPHRRFELTPSRLWVRRSDQLAS
jgi:hypothetical protein